MNFRKLSAMLAGAALVAASLVSSAPEAHAVKAYKVSISVSSSRVPEGASVTISGKVNLKSKSRRTIKVQYRYAGSKAWKTAKSVTATKAGRFSVSIAATSNASWRVCKAKDKKGKAKCSKAVSITTYATPPAPTETATPTPTPVPVVNTAGAATIPESQGDYNWTSDEARFSQRRREEAAGFSLSAATSGRGPLTVSGLSPAGGPLSGGTIVTLTGAGLDTVTGAKMVKAAWTSQPIGDDAEGQSYAEDSIGVRFKRISATTLQIVTPAWGAGDSQVVVVNDISSASATFRYERGVGQGTNFNAINTRRIAGGRAVWELDDRRFSGTGVGRTERRCC